MNLLMSDSVKSSGLRPVHACDNVIIYTLLRSNYIWLDIKVGELNLQTFSLINRDCDSYRCLICSQINYHGYN